MGVSSFLATFLLGSCCFFNVHAFASSTSASSDHTTQNMSAAPPTVADESSANLGRWSERWSAGRIGFHLEDVNPVIQKFGPKYLSSDDEKESCSNKRVFVPLCGKTVDLAYLTTKAGHVVGAEGIRVAIEQFAKEQPQLMISSTETSFIDGFEKFDGDKITLLKGDYFELDPTKTDGQFDFIYDRASMVAIQPDLRNDYVDVLEKLLLPGGAVLLVVLERISTSEEAMKEGPPFSIPDSVVREIYEKRDWVESITMLEKSDQLETKPEDKERYPDLDHLFETVYEIKRKA